MCSCDGAGYTDVIGAWRDRVLELDATGRAFSSLQHTVQAVPRPCCYTAHHSSQLLGQYVIIISMLLTRFLLYHKPKAIICNNNDNNHNHKIRLKCVLHVAKMGLLNYGTISLAFHEYY
ncbi:conserved hypothetical protein [Trichinella spiralis]|uniref:Uncharacterized protein n=1 Tax=Trichinella spiralis TaxID=6334 RepID=E5SLD0_TRISP|nr:conserved hypothetical protein [Trichinella spiralis]KRY33710.1 hypothetical protein T01_1562 [Trichinella spiralis]